MQGHLPSNEQQAQRLERAIEGVEDEPQDLQGDHPQPAKSSYHSKGGSSRSPGEYTSAVP